MESERDATKMPLFSYLFVSQILKSISFTVEEGQTVAVLGDKGCGKTALVKLLQRIYDPQKGKVRLKILLFRAVFQSNAVKPKLK